MINECSSVNLKLSGLTQRLFVSATSNRIPTELVVVSL